jgi:hypothetical protein
MTRLFCILIFLITSDSVFSQLNDTITQKSSRIRFGFYISICSNYYHFKESGLGTNSIEEINQVPRVGFGTGLCSEIRLTQNVSFCAEAGISFYETKLHVKTSKVIDDVIPVNLLQLPLLLKYEMSNRKVNFIGGIDLNYNLVNKTKNDLLINGSNAFYVLGIQNNFRFKTFNLVPEIRFSHSLYNGLKRTGTNVNTGIQNSKISILSLVFLFI